MDVIELAEKKDGKFPTKNKAAEDKEIDHLTSIIGVFGPYQGIIYCVMGLTISMHCWQMMSNKFLTYPTEYWCARPASQTNLSIDQWLNFSAPLKNEADFDKCMIFDVDYNATKQRPEATEKVVECQHWEYKVDNFDETITKRWNLVCNNMPNFPRIVQIVFFVGNMMGVLLIGPFSDWYGRKTAYMTALTIWSGVTIIGFLVDNPYAWIITRFLAGAASLAYNTAADVYRVELTSGAWRSKAGHWFGELPWQLGHLSLGLLVYLLPNMNHLELFIGLSALPFMSLWWLLPESPRWLLAKGKTSQALKVINLACKINNKPTIDISQLEVDTAQDENEPPKGTLKGQFKQTADDVNKQLTFQISYNTLPPEETYFA